MWNVATGSMAGNQRETKTCHETAGCLFLLFYGTEKEKFCWQLLYLSPQILEDRNKKVRFSALQIYINRSARTESGDWLAVMLSGHPDLSTPSHNFARGWRRRWVDDAGSGKDRDGGEEVRMVYQAWRWAGRGCKVTIYQNPKKRTRPHKMEDSEAKCGQM